MHADSGALRVQNRRAIELDNGTVAELATRTFQTPAFGRWEQREVLRASDYGIHVLIRVYV